MFNSVGWGEMLLLLTVGLLLLGPERLPGHVSDLVRLARHLHDYSSAMKSELREQLGPDFGMPKLFDPSDASWGIDPPSSHQIERLAVSFPVDNLSVEGVEQSGDLAAREQ